MYTIHQTLASNSRSVLYRGVRCEDGLPVVLKVLTPQHRSQHLASLRHEYEIGRALQVQAAVKPLSLETYEGYPALVFEDFGGESLDRLLCEPMAVGRFLPVAVRIAAAVSELHQHSVLHKDLKPDNILMNPRTGEVKLADFGIAALLPCPARRSARLLEGSLPYISPEQTGRMNRALDPRSDLYSLGVTFYQLLTGQLPFHADDPLEWAHCHIARSPIPPAELEPTIPSLLSAIVMKLLAKETEERYQSARGLQRDLERCLAEWATAERIDPFPLAEHDVSERFQISQRFYGREEELAALLGSFERVVAHGAPELVLISGYAGIGKSSLVRELQKPIVRERGCFAAGKFDQYKRDIPYSTIVDAFTELVRELLTESEERIAVFRERLQAALGINGQLIVNVIPQVALVLPPQPQVPSLPLTEAQNRFHRVLLRFIAAFAQREHPLVLFFDDLQWADSASLGILHSLVTSPETHDLLVLGAYRDNEVSPTHPLRLTVDTMRKEGAHLLELGLGPLSQEQLTLLVADTLQCRREEATPLAQLVHEKTAGNPFFVGQFLTALHEERLIEFDGCAEAWRWDVERIRKRRFTDNIVDLMVDKLKRLPPATQQALTQLACLGNTAELPLLTSVYGRSEDATHADLREGVRAGLVIRTSDTYTFLHDRVQEAAYSLIPEGERAALHLQLGRLLAARTPPAELEEKIFEIVNQLNRGAALITSREEREHVAELDLIAGKRAKKSTAYASALAYLAAGAARLDADSWDLRYELTFSLELNRAECEYLTGALGASEERLSVLSRRARGLVDVAAVTCARVALYTNQDRSDRSVEVCLEYLRLTGVEWSAHPTDEDVQRELDRLWQQLGSRPVEALIDLPPMTAPDCCATMDVLTWAEAPALFSDKNLLCLVICRMANLSLEHGISDASCIAFVWLGALLGPRFGSYRMGFRFGKLGFDLLERSGQLRFKARVYLGFGHRISHWSRHLREGHELLRRGFDAAQQTGDLTYAAYTCTCLLTLLLAKGEPLWEVQREAERSLEFTRKARFGLIVDIITGQLRFILSLRGLLPDFSTFNGAEFDEARFEQHLEGDPHLAIATCWYWIRKLQARFFAGDAAHAVAAADKAERLLWTSSSFFELAEYHFYAALARASYLDAAPEPERPRHLAAIRAHIQQLQSWAQSCPENFGNRLALVSAELARVEGRERDAAHLYEEAIRSARDNGFVQNEAVAYELGSRFHRAQGFAPFADLYLREARAAYARWGADGKVRQLGRIHPQLVERRPLVPTSVATLALGTEQLDVLSVVKASQAISGEIRLDSLLRRLVEVVIEQAGAQKGYLLLRKNGQLVIEAEASLDDKGAVQVKLLRSLPGASSPLLPASILGYVARTKQAVLLANAAAAPAFSTDEYIARARPKSVLCLPILKQAELVGLLYLENNLITGAFPSEQLQVLELLACQAAISLESAQRLAAEQAARVAAEAAERRTALLAQASALLSESLDYQQVLKRLASVSVRDFADSFLADLLEGGEITRVAGVHADPIKQSVLEEIARRYPVRLNSQNAVARVIRTGEPMLLPEISEAVLLTSCVDEEHRRLVRVMGMNSALLVPMIARGHTIGAISMGACKPDRRFERADLELAMELAHRAAIAVDNARLYRQSQEALRLRDEFLSVASHELRTPMTSLTLALQAMQGPRLSVPEGLGRLVDLAARQGQRMTRLINELLDVSRLQWEELPLHLTEVDLGALVREVLKRIELNLAQAGCEVTVEEAAPVVGRWDPSRLDQVVTNLLSNASKFGAGKPIVIQIGRQEGTARLLVQDHGIGIDPAQQARIFERFGRAVSARNYGGLGLGLYISRSIVGAHGGTIQVISQPGAGATFQVNLPCAGPSQNAEPIPSASG